MSKLGVQLVHGIDMDPAGVFLALGVPVSESQVQITTDVRMSGEVAKTDVPKQVAPGGPLAAHVGHVQAPTRTWHVGAAPGRDCALFGAWKSKHKVHPWRVRSVPCRAVEGVARRPARPTSSAGNSFWCGRPTGPKSSSGTGSVGDR